MSNLSETGTRESPKILGRTAKLRGWLEDDGGDAIVEYVVLVGTVAIVVMPALIAAGIALVNNFERLRNLAALPIP